MSQEPQCDQIQAILDVTIDLRRELDAANKLVKELYDENDRLLKKILNMKSKVTG